MSKSRNCKWCHSKNLIEASYADGPFCGNCGRLEKGGGPVTIDALALVDTRNEQLQAAQKELDIYRTANEQLIQERDNYRKAFAETNEHNDRLQVEAEAQFATIQALDKKAGLLRVEVDDVLGRLNDENKALLEQQAELRTALEEIAVLSEGTDSRDNARVWDLSTGALGTVPVRK